jgi:SecD/SecF fusion protein
LSDRRKYLLLMGLIVAALAGSLLLAVPGSPVFKKPTLGLDLQGGLEVVLRAQPPKGQKVDAAGLTLSETIMRNRVDKLGVSEPDVRKQPPDQIVIQLAGVHDAEKAAALIGKTAQLEMYDIETDATGPTAAPPGDPTGAPVPSPSLYGLLTAVKDRAKKGSPNAYYLFKTSGKKGKLTHSLKEGPTPTLTELLRRYGGKVPKGFEVLGEPAGTQVLSCAAQTGCIGAGRTGIKASPTYYYLVKYRPAGKNPIPELTGSDLKKAAADFAPAGGPIVTMQFSGHGGKVFEKITKQEADRGSQLWSIGGRQGDPKNYAQHFAIVLDRQIESTPYIDFQQNPDGIAGGQAQIDLSGGTIQEAKDLALVLQTGSLPYKFTQIERTDVSSTLGKDSLRQAWIAALIGLAVVAVFLLLFYRFLGLVAVIGLGIYAAFLYAALLLFHVTLTLPGFAGLVLTIGVAADANIVIFERIKEEVRAGKSVRAAVGAGYGKGFHTILDANVVTAITALVLFAVATAGVKGFALVLLVGTLISLLTAVVATRAMLGLLAGFRWFGNAKLMGAGAQQHGKWLEFDYMGKRKLWFALSGVIILVSAVSLGVKGLNLGIDFKGGSQITFVTPKAQDVSVVRSEFGKISHPGAVVQGRGSQDANGRFKSFQVRDRALTDAQLSKLKDDLRGRLGVTAVNVNTVSASFGKQIAKDAILAIIVSLLLIVIYITIRFDLKFAIPVIVAMLHDVLITVGLYSIVGREVSTSTVAAVLTVLGFSIYDTIIIFDRVRENIPLFRKAPFAQIVNVSLWETIRRSLATSFITLLPVVALLIFGGQTLKDFAFALIVGIISGAYSSIFIAAPLLTIMKEREPEYSKRQTVAMPTGAAADALLHQAERVAAAEPTPRLEQVVPAPRAVDGDKLERRRQRRKSRPHGRAR